MHKFRKPHDGIPSKMMLLHLRWQQIRLELLQQASFPMSLGKENHVEPRKKDPMMA